MLGVRKESVEVVEDLEPGHGPGVSIDVTGTGVRARLALRGLDKLGRCFEEPVELTLSDPNSGVELDVIGHRVVSPCGALGGVLAKVTRRAVPIGRAATPWTDEHFGSRIPDLGATNPTTTVAIIQRPAPRRWPRGHGRQQAMASVVVSALALPPPPRLLVRDATLRGPTKPARCHRARRGWLVCAGKDHHRMTKRLLSALFWAFVTVSSLVLYPVAVLIWAVTVTFDRRLVVLHRFTCFWASLYTWFNPAWRVTLDGRDKIQPGTTYVMVANHLSLLDILVLFRLFRHFKWVSKIENFKVPVIGWNMSMNRYIKLRRGDRASVLRMMRACEKTIGEGSSIMMFPEGTRSTTGEMRPFKPGAFELARKTGTPILPIVISGTADALPKRGFVLQGRHPIGIRILDPIPPDRWADMSADELAAHVREVIAGRDLHSGAALDSPTPA